MTKPGSAGVLLPNMEAKVEWIDDFDLFLIAGRWLTLMGTLLVSMRSESCVCEDPMS